jgi:NNP family nitrate/nitrite transporter-like MFS transporter
MIPVALVLLLFVIVAREPSVLPQSGDRQSWRDLLSQPDLWRFSLLYSLTFGGFVGLAGFLAIYLHDQYATPAVLAGTLTALCVFGGSFFRPVGGYLADRVGGTRLLFYLFPLIGISFVAISFANSLPISIALLVIGMMLLGTGNGAIFQLVPERYPKEIGVVSGIVGAAGSLGGSLIPLMLGTLKQWTGTYAPGFALFVAIVQLSLVPLYFYHRKRGKLTAAVLPQAMPQANALPEDAASQHNSWDTGRIRMNPAYVTMSRQ